MDVVGHKGSGKTHSDKPKAEETEKDIYGGKVKFPAAGGAHNPSNRLPAGEDSFAKKTKQNPDRFKIVIAVLCLR